MWLTKEMIQNKLRTKPKPALNAGQLHACIIGKLIDSAPMTLLVRHNAIEEDDRPQHENGSHQEDQPIQTIMPVQQESEGERRQRRVSGWLRDENSFCNHDEAANTNQEWSVLTGRDDDLAVAETAGRAILTSFGRPKGTTMETYRDLKARVQLATAEAAAKYSIVKEIAKKKN